MRWLPILTLLLSLSGPAQAFTLFETEPNDCFCEATPGGTAQTTAISGVLDDGDIDFFRFEFAQPVPYLAIRPISPDIAGDDSYRVFDIALFDESESLLMECSDCWFLADSLQAYDLPAGVYYIAIADFDGLAPPEGPGISANQEDPPPESRGLGAYGVAISTPEPASMALLGVAVAGLILRRRR